MRDRSSGISTESSIATGSESREDPEWGWSRFIGSAGYADDSEVIQKTKTYWLYRIVDHSGISGRGLIANVAVFPNGKAVAAWCVSGRPPAATLFDSIDDLINVHGHGGDTVLIPEE